MKMKARGKDDFGLDLGDLFGDFDNFDPSLMGDPGAFGLGDLPGFDDIVIPPSEWDTPPMPTSGDFGGSDAPGGDGFNWSSIASQLGRLFGGSGGGSGGGLNLGSLLPLIAGIGGGINQNNRTEQATDAMLRANDDAMNVIRERMGGMAAPFKPYTDAGASAVGQMANMGPSNLAARYRPLGSGRGINLGAMTRGRG